jgi:hypothetical protein
MPVAVLTILKFCLVALIFLFLARVLRAVWAEISGPLGSGAGTDGGGDRSIAGAGGTGGTGRTGDYTEAETAHTERSGRRSKRNQAHDLDGSQLELVEPVELRGATFDLTPEMTIGRAPGCAIVLDDSFASQLHARVFQRDRSFFVEDLGSRNGTWLNRDEVHGPLQLQAGDRIKIGDTVLAVTRPEVKR